MLRRFVKVGVVTAALLCATGLHARQRILVPGARRRVVPPPAAARPPAVVRPPANAIRPRDNAPPPAGLPQEWVDQLQGMRPAEQQRFLKNNERFRSLPADQQALIRERLKAWNSLPPEQRQALLERQQIWAQLPPDQRRQVRESLMPRWQNIPPRRREVILGKLRELRGLDGAQRSAKLNDEAFLGNLDPDERQMLRELANLGVG